MANQGLGAGAIDAPLTLCDKIARFEDRFIAEILESIPVEKLNSIADDVTHYDTQKGSSILAEPMLHDPTQLIDCSDQLLDVIDYIKSAIYSGNYPPGNRVRVKLEYLYSLWTSATSLKQLDRFVSSDQPALDDWPRDTSDLNNVNVNPSGHSSFGLEKELRELTIGFLHLPGILQLAVPPNPDQAQNIPLDMQRYESLGHLYLMARLLLQQEFEKVTVDEKDAFAEHNNVTSARWIAYTRQSVLDVLERLAVVACSPTAAELDRRVAENRRDRARAGRRPLNGNEEAQYRENEKEKGTAGLTTKQKIDANFDEGGVTFIDELIQEMKDGLILDDHLIPLVHDLVRREDMFEAALAVEHYEDKLVTKQFSILDEQQFADNRSWVPNMSTGFLNDLFETTEVPRGQTSKEYQNYEEMVHLYFHDMGLVNRHRRNFRLLRDWAGKRPWKQIYQLYKSTNREEPAWVENGVYNFHMRAIKPFDHNPSPPPSSYQNVIPQVFGFVPIDTAIVDFGLDFRQGICALCQKAYYQGHREKLNGFGSTIMELRCTAEHKFHLKCLFDFWDGPGKYLHTCPTCGEMAQLNYETVGLDTAAGDFVHNNQGYYRAATVAIWLGESKEARRSYDVPPVPIYTEQGKLYTDSNMAPPPTRVEAGKAYYRDEVNLSVNLWNLGLSWTGLSFGPGDSARFRTSRPITEPEATCGYEVDIHPGRINERNDQARSNHERELQRELINRVARETGASWLQRPANRGRDGTDTLRFLPPARLPPLMEAAFLRRARRRREHKLRERIRTEGRGVSFL